MPELFPVQIADLTAWGFANPERLNIGGAQRLGVHQLPAGVRILDSMGADDADIKWSGMFFQRGSDPDPVEAARYLDYLRKQGAPVQLSWDVFMYEGIIESFSAEYEFITRLPFSISFKVLQDLTAPVTTFDSGDVDDLVDTDWANSLSILGELNMTVGAGLPGPFSNVVGAAQVAASTIAWNAPPTFSLNLGLGPYTGSLRLTLYSGLEDA